MKRWVKNNKDEKRIKKNRYNDFCSFCTQFIKYKTKLKYICNCLLCNTIFINISVKIICLKKSIKFQQKKR